MKKIFLVVISLIIIILLLFCLCNKTFFKTYYEVKNSKEEIVKIPLPLFSYYTKENSDKEVIFKTLRGTKTIQNQLSKYVENLSSCYDEGYFYDDNLDITISEYIIVNEFPFNKISLKYSKGNYCKNEYVLNDGWYNEYINNAKISEIVIDKCSIKNTKNDCTTLNIKNSDIINIINNSLKGAVRIENNKNISLDVGSDYYLISSYYTIGKQGYTLEIFKYNSNLVFRIIDANDHSKNALYSINEDIDKLFENILKNN